MKAKISFSNIIAYLQGKLRYKLYYSPYLFWLMRNHIKEQIDWRIHVMDKACYTSGACMLCGCSTTALQMARKSCDKPCYPPMMSRSKWKSFKGGFVFQDAKGIIWGYKSETEERHVQSPYS